MKIVMAPILPHLSEEIHDAMMKRKNELSVFTEGWRAVVRSLVQFFFRCENGLISRIGRRME